MKFSTKEYPLRQVFYHLSHSASSKPLADTHTVAGTFQPPIFRQTVVSQGNTVRTHVLAPAAAARARLWDISLTSFSEKGPLLPLRRQGWWRVKGAARNPDGGPPVHISARKGHCLEMWRLCTSLTYSPYRGNTQPLIIRHPTDGRFSSQFLISVIVHELLLYYAA